MPPEEPRQVIAVRLNPVDVEWVDRVASADDVTRSDVIRAAIAHFIEDRNDGD